MKEYFAFQWHITDECDQRCKHCYIFSEDNCKKLDAMTWEQMQDTFYNCLALLLYYRRRPDFTPGFLAAACFDERAGYSFYYSWKSISSIR